MNLTIQEDTSASVSTVTVLFEDNHIIVVEKKPNIPSQADKTEDLDMLTIVKQYIKEKYILINFF